MLRLRPLSTGVARALVPARTSFAPTLAARAHLQPSLIAGARALSTSRALGAKAAPGARAAPGAPATSAPAASGSADPWDVKPVELSFDLHEPPERKKGCIVILHGLLGSKANWRGLARRFAKELSMPVYTLDLRNHGRSPHVEPHTYPAMAVDVAHFLRTHGLHDVHLVGHSMGGKTAMAFALNKQFNGLLKTLISVDIAPTNGPIEPQYDDYLKGMKEIEAARVPSRKEADSMLLPYEPDQATRQFLLTNAMMQHGHVCFRVAMETLASATSGLGTFPYHVQNGKADATFGGPTLFLRGSKSDYVMDKDLADARRFFPRLEVETVDAGHWVHAEKPKETGDAVVEFVSAFSRWG